MQEKKFFVNIDLQSNEVVKLKADTLDITSNPASGNTKRIVYYNGQYYYSNGTNWVSLSGGGGGSVTDVTATTPLSSSGGTSPDISIDQADTTTDGYLSSTDWNTFNSKLGYTGATQDVNLGAYKLTANKLELSTKAEISLSGNNLIVNNTTADAITQVQFDAVDFIKLTGAATSGTVTSLDITLPTLTGQSGNVAAASINLGIREWANGSYPVSGSTIKSLEILGEEHTYPIIVPPPDPDTKVINVYLNSVIDPAILDENIYALGLNGNLLIEDGYNLDLGTTTGTKIGTTATQKLGFFGTTPVVKPASVTTVQGLADALSNLGLINSSTIPSDSGASATNNLFAYYNFI